MISIMKMRAKKIIGTIRHLQYAGKIKRIPSSFLIQDVPYYCQWESPDLVESILTNKISAGEDPNWKKSGAKTKNEYLTWSANACGMACTKMFLAKEFGRSIPIIELGKQSTRYGAYTMPLESSPGLAYKPYIKYLKAEFDVEAKLALPLSLNQIVYELSQYNYVLASVSPMIRDTESVPSTTGGHLVLLLGYDLDTKELSFHNPSGFSKETQEYTKISFDDFNKFFGKRGIVVKSSKLID